MFGRGCEQQARQRLSATAAVRVIVVAHIETIQGKRMEKERVHLLHRGAGLGAARNVGLIGHNVQQEPARAQLQQGLARIGKDAQFERSRRRVRFPFAQLDLVEHAIAIEEYGASCAVS
jgi:hypothetical protein